MEFISLLNELDNGGHYRAVDILFKAAFDLTPFTTPKNELGKGGFGSFYSNFDDSAKKISRDPNLGLKVFHKKMWSKDISQNIGEFICFKCFAPLINKHTPFKAPNVEGQSFSSFLGNNSIISQKMPGSGESPKEIVDQIYSAGIDTTEDTELIARVLMNIKLPVQVRRILRRNVGIEWDDAKTGNYLLGPNAVKVLKDIIIQIHKETNGTIDQGLNVLEKFHSLQDYIDTRGDVLKSVIDTGQIYIIDFGLMEAIEGTLAADAIKRFEANFQQSLKKREGAENNELIQQISKVFGWLLIKRRT